MKPSRTAGFSFSRFRAIVKKEFLQIRKDPPSLAIALVMPIMMLLLFGYAVNTDVDHLPTGVWDQAKTEDSRQLVAQFTNTLYFDQVYQAEGYQDLQRMIDMGKIKVGIVIPPDFSYNLDKEKKTQIQILVDGADPNAARTAAANAQIISQHLAMVWQEERLAKQGLGNIESALDAQIRVLYNPNMKSLIFNIPALIGLIMQNVTAILTAFALVREKERGTMEQLIVTPIRPAELILGKLVPYVCVGIFSFAVILITGVAWFGVPVKGSLPLLMLLSFLFLLTVLALGIVISTVSATQLQAMQVSFAIILPSVLLSGFMFPRETMPWAIRLFSAVIPLTYFLDILRGIFLKGIGLAELWKDTLALLVFTTALCTVAIVRFRKKLE